MLTCVGHGVSEWSRVDYSVCTRVQLDLGPIIEGLAMMNAYATLG